jgi:hypothetical protein
MPIVGGLDIHRRCHCQVTIGVLRVKMWAVCRISVGDGRTLSLQTVSVGVCLSRPTGPLPGRSPGSPDLPGHLPTLSGAGAQVSGEIYLRGDPGLMTTSSRSHPRRAGTGARTKDEAAVLAASAHLTDRDRDLVRLVAVHRVLATDQLCALGFGKSPPPGTGSARWCGWGCCAASARTRRPDLRRGITCSDRSAPRCPAWRTATSTGGHRTCGPTGNSPWNAPRG